MVSSVNRVVGICILFQWFLRPPPPPFAPALLPGFSRPLWKSWWCIAPVVAPHPYPTTPYFTGCPSLPLASPGVGSTRLGGGACVSLCPPTCPQMPVCVANVTARNIPVWKMMCFTPVTVIFNVSICLVQTWNPPTRPPSTEQKHKGSLLVCTRWFFVLFLSFKLFICLCLFVWPFLRQTI